MYTLYNIFFYIIATFQIALLTIIEKVNKFNGPYKRLSKTHYIDMYRKNMSAFSPRVLICNNQIYIHIIRSYGDATKNRIENSRVSSSLRNTMQFFDAKNTRYRKLENLKDSPILLFLRFMSFLRNLRSLDSHTGKFSISEKMGVCTLLRIFFSSFQIFSGFLLKKSTIWKYFAFSYSTIFLNTKKGYFGKKFQMEK